VGWVGVRVSQLTQKEKRSGIRACVAAMTLPRTLPQSEKMMHITMRLKSVRANHLSGHKMSRVLNRFQLAFAIQLC
jgi:hypothetical protein